MSRKYLWLGAPSCCETYVIPRTVEQNLPRMCTAADAVRGASCRGRQLSKVCACKMIREDESDHGNGGACIFVAGVGQLVLHGESITDQASPRTPTQRTFQPQEAVQPQQNQTILQADTPAQKANYSYKRSHPTPLEADATTPRHATTVWAS